MNLGTITLTLGELLSGTGISVGAQVALSVMGTSRHVPQS